MNKPILLVVMDGVGISKTHLGDAVSLASTPYLDYMLKNFSSTSLKAHGLAVGLPSDSDMGNSEVGHNALGCGQIYSQGSKLVNESIESKKIYKSDTWIKLIENVKKNNSTLHFIGLLSDGNVHSNINHLFSMLEKTKEEGVKKVRIHILLDGRDVPSTSALLYVSKLEDVLNNLNDSNFDAQIASGGGRMVITMDRYQANWKMVEKGWNIHVKGEGRGFNSAKEAIETYRKEIPNIIDQDLPGFVIKENDEPIGKMNDNDSVILFNFRGDRAIELSMAFNDPNFNYFIKDYNPKVMFAGLLEYDGDLHIPTNYLVNPPEIHDTLTEVLVKNNINEYAISETQKYGHVTYFWNGNRTDKFSEELETYVKIDSDTCSFDLKPAMKCYEITNKLIEALKSHQYQFLRVNYPNGDMVGHTGNLDATIKSLEALDECLGKLLDVCIKENYIMLVTADHGNADEMLEKNSKGEIVVRTAHSLNKVPFIIVDDKKYEFIDEELGLSNVAPTILKLLDIEIPKTYQKIMIK